MYYGLDIDTDMLIYRMPGHDRCRLMLRPRADFLPILR